DPTLSPAHGHAWSTTKVILLAWAPPGRCSGGPIGILTRADRSCQASFPAPSAPSQGPGPMGGASGGGEGGRDTPVETRRRARQGPHGWFMSVSPSDGSILASGSGEEGFGSG